MAAAEGADLQPLGRAEGLSSEGVTALAVEGGTLLIGTLAGLDRLQDGLVSRLPVPLPDGPVTALLADGGALWVGTAEGLARREQTGDWESWTRGEAGLRQASVTSLAPGGLVGTYGDGVLRWRREGATTDPPGFTPLGERGPAWVTALAVDDSGVWAGTPSEGLWHWNGTRWIRFTPPGTPSDTMITALLVDSERRENHGTAEQRNTQTRQHENRAADQHSALSIQHPTPKPQNSTLNTQHSKLKTQNSSSVLWVGTRGGLWRFAPGRGWRATTLTAPITALGRNEDGLLAATGPRLYQSREGGEWSEVALTVSGVITALVSDESGSWIGALGDGVRRWGAPVPVRAPRLPVVLVHGYDDAPDVYRSQFHFLARWLRQDGWPVFYAADLTPDEPLLDNATRLADTIAAAREATGADRVLLIAHSFGGLTARVYLGSDLYRHDVAGLVTLGTPHAGAHLVYDFLARDLAHGDRRPATAELLPEHMALLERFLADRNVPMLAIGGDRLPDGVLLAGLPPNDGLITANSAVAARGATTALAPLAHGWTPSLLGLQVESYLFPERLYRETIRPWLVEQAGGGADSLSRPLPLPPAPPPPGQTREPLAHRILDPREAITVPTTLTTDETVHFFLTWNQGTLAFDLIEPDGTHHGHDRPTLSDEIKHLALTASELRPLSLWSVRAPARGRWQAVISNPGTVPAEAWLDAVRPAGPQLTLSVLRPAPSEGVVEISATETSGRPTETLPPILRARLNDREVPLQRVDQGAARATILLPSSPGYYPLEVSGRGWTRWTILTREDTSATPTVTIERLADGGATITATVESTGSGRYALGLEVWTGQSAEPSPTTTPRLRRLSAPRRVVPGATVRVVWRLAPGDLPEGTVHILARVTALNATGPLVSGRHSEAQS